MNLVSELHKKTDEMKAWLIKIEDEIVHAPAAPVPPPSPHLATTPGYDSSVPAATGHDSPTPVHASSVVLTELTTKPPRCIKQMVGRRC